MTEEQIAKLEKDAELAQRREQAERQMAQVQPVWKIKEQQGLKDYYGRMNDAHDRTMQSRRARMAASPGSFNPWDKASVDKYFADKTKEDKRIKDDQFRNNELETKENIAAAERDGRIGYGRDAAIIKADADRYISDNNLKGIEKQAQAQQEMERQKREFEKWRTSEGFRLEDDKSRREHGFWDDNGEYHPGSRERTGKATAESRMTLESLRQDGREIIQKMKGDQRLESEQMKQLFGIAGKILNKDGKYKMKDAEMEAEKLGISPESLRSYFKQIGVTQDEEQKQSETAAVTPRASAIRINRFA